MVYVEFMKNIHIADSNEVTALSLISAYSPQKRLISYFIDIMYVVFMKNFYHTDWKK